MKLRLYVPAGRFGYSTVRLVASSTSGSRSRRIRLPCWKGAGRAEPSDAITAEEAVKDPFVLEFLGLRDEYSESDLEEALIHNLTDFLLELGDDFAFLGRQKRLRLDDTWFRIDLLFFHRRLRCLVVIDLKVGKFSYADAGQMHLYLNYAREHWMKAGENPPVGLILCAEKGAAMLSITCRTKCFLPSIKPCSRTRNSLQKNWNDHAHSLKNGVQASNLQWPTSTFWFDTALSIGLTASASLPN